MSENIIDPGQYLLGRVSAGKADGQAYYELRYKLTRTDDLTSAIERHENYIDGSQYEISAFREEWPGVKDEHMIKAAIIWDEIGRQAAIRAGYEFAEPIAEPSEEEVAEVEAKLAESQDGTFQAEE